MLEKDERKKEIIELFRNNVKGKSPDVCGINPHHDGKKGHWLEHQFGVASNGNNAPDLYGFELKCDTSSKTTFGDWSANVYVYTNPKYSSFFEGKAKYQKQNSFVKIFGKPNAEKNNRYSWSGEPTPKISGYNSFGQILKIENNNDVVAYYSFSKDKRPNKEMIVPKELQIDNLEIAKWYGETSPTRKRSDKCIKEKLEDKFDVNGWFTCKKDENGKYYKICFGGPFTFDKWIDLVKKGIVYFDSGMYEGNKRPYSQWRADNRYWNSLIEETYE